MTARLVPAPRVAALLLLGGSMVAGALVTGTLVAGGTAAAATAEESGGPRYSYFDAGYQWTDVNYAVKQQGGQHAGFKLNGSVSLVNIGPVGVHMFGEFFDGNFTGAKTSCGNVDRNSQSIAGGLGLNYAVRETTDLVVRGAYVDISEFQVPNNTCDLVSTSDHGYFAEALVRSELSENVEVEAGVRYSELKDSNIGNTDVILGLGYHVTNYLTLRARGLVFDNDTGIEIGARLYFGSFIGRDTLF